jgi:coenzyme F420 hydrogenase subunit beta
MTTPVRSTISDLECIQRVVEGGYCIGCGACAAARPDLFQIELNDFGEYEARRQPDAPPAASDASMESICPFSGRAKNEDEIGQQLYGHVGTYDSRVGYHLESFVGFVAESDFRTIGSSGGFCTWVLGELLEQNKTDGIIHVWPHAEPGGGHPLFKYNISRTIDEVRNAAKSRYYPIELSEVLQQVRETPDRYTFVGVPCFVKAVRLLAQQDSVLRERINYCIALICGHLKSAAYADAIAWESGVHPTQVRDIDFRHKSLDRRPNEFVARIGLREGGELMHPMEDLVTRDWGVGLFKYRACEYCDDVVGETADLSVGDAWLPPHIDDPRGTNLVIVRHPELLEMIHKSISAGRLRMRPIEVDDAVRSLSSGFRHRREGLRYRLWRKSTRHQWFPEKRVPPDPTGISRRYQRIFTLREELAEECRQAFLSARRAGNFGLFLERMGPLLKQYQSLYRGPLWRRTLVRLKRYGKFVAGKLRRKSL